MERVLSVDEKIRRAEEIYLRRAQNSNRKYATVNIENTKKSGFTKKMITQFIICLIIYILFYGIQNSESFLSENITSKIKEILQYDINIQALQNKFNSYIEVNENNNTVFEENTLEEATLSVTDNPEAESSELENNGTEIETVENEVSENEISENNVEEKVEVIESQTEETSSISQMEDNANYIKANYSFIQPVEGQITSRFGLRENVNPKYHTGIDIAEDIGYPIAVAMEGTVELVSSEGNYGNHFIIKNGDVTTLYAHCNKIYIKQGDYVKQGDIVAEIGATGNVTGPHLHFEILRNGEYVDPDLVIPF